MKYKDTAEFKAYDLERKGFKKSEDKISDYLFGADLYSLKKEEGFYIVFVHFNKSKKEQLQGFDCYISKYNSINEIGLVPAKYKDHIRLSFDFDTDWPLIRERVEKELRKLKVQ